MKTANYYTFEQPAKEDIITLLENIGGYWLPDYDEGSLIVSDAQINIHFDPNVVKSENYSKDELQNAKKLIGKEPRTALIIEIFNQQSEALTYGFCDLLHEKWGGALEKYQVDLMLPVEITGKTELKPKVIA